MSQEYKGKGKELSEEGPSTPAPLRPKYVTVGSGSTSESAARLQALLDNDSGYGGSVAGGSVHGGSSWNPMNTEDRPTPAASPALRDQTFEGVENDRKTQASAIHQLWYNQHRSSLGRSISKVIELLEGLQDMNKTWPATYPSVQRAFATSSNSDHRPALVHTQSIAVPPRRSKEAGEESVPRPGAMRRSQTTGLQQPAESSKQAEEAKPAEPRLITPQIAQEFSILKLDLKLGSLHQTELVHSLEKGSIASLLNGKITSSIKHLLSLRSRIEDTSSKVLVTGDLNAGKSTFCNALLRRKILPEDQQPCTSLFCEVVDARENRGVEEVHAIHKDMVYNKDDETTYDVYTLLELEEIVLTNEKYMQCKVYVKDVRSIDESLLNNGIVDISIIDAPGLNSDTTKTTAVFARQEEIDVVVFVVSAANHFTITATDFISTAAAEKAYIFMVVNGYDNIRDKERCKKTILEQVYRLSPRTFKESSDLVHFVSSNAVPLVPGPPGGGGGGSGSSSGGSGDPGDDDDSDPKGKGKENEKQKIRDFEKLEQSLRKFVLEKRARSKLAPAKTYLLNILEDVHTLADVNLDVAQSELKRVTKELDELTPILEQSQKAKAEVSDDIDRTIDETCKEIYDHTRNTLKDTISQVAESDLGVPYPGLLNAFQFADDLKEAMLSQIALAVQNCEETARTKTVSGVSAIKQLGILHLGDQYADLSFKSNVMFRRKRDVLARQVEIETEIWDFFDLSSMWQKQEKLAGTGMAITVAGAVGTRMVGGYGWIDGAVGTMRVVGHDNLRKLIIPGLIAGAFATAYYVLTLVPYTLPHRLQGKIQAHLQSTDFIHSNSDRISSSVRKVLRFPADNLRVGLQRSVEQLGVKKGEMLKTRGESEVARKYFSNLVSESGRLKGVVDAVDLEGQAPGVAASYDA